jgi:hypothetical protein
MMSWRIVYMYLISLIAVVYVRCSLLHVACGGFTLFALRMQSDLGATSS